MNKRVNEASIATFVGWKSFINVEDLLRDEVQKLKPDKIKYAYV